MTGNAMMDSGRRGIPWRAFGWGTAASVLLLPLILQAPWTLSDYVTMGGMLGVAGLGIELAVRASGDLAYRGGAVIAVVAAFLLVWVNLAVGLLGDESNPANLLFAGVLAVAAIGSALARGRAAGMARAMIATTAAQLLVGVVGLAAALGSPGAKGIYEAVMGTSLFAAPWLASAWLFGKAARASS